VCFNVHSQFTLGVVVGSTVVADVFTELQVNISNMLINTLEGYEDFSAALTDESEALQDSIGLFKTMVK
jgi:hypothetical protein